MERFAPEMTERNFFAELKRRSVYRVLLAACLVIQAAHSSTPPD